MSPIILNTDGDPRDLTTLDAVKRLLAQTTTKPSDDLVRDLITEASVMLTRELGRQFLPETGATKTFTYGGGGWVNVAPHDLRTVTAVSYDADGTTPVALTSGTWRLRGHTGNDTYRDLFLEDYTGTRPVASDPVTVGITGDWGFAEVPADVERGVKITVKTWLRDDPIMTADGGFVRAERVGKIPADVLDGLSHYRLPVIY